MNSISCDDIKNDDAISVGNGISISVAADKASGTGNASATKVLSNGDVLLANTMPQAEYMYGCTPTAVAMLLGYYDLYGYQGKDFSALIDGVVEVNSRGTDGNAYDMDAFDTVLGRAIATKEYVYRFYSRGDIEVIMGNKAGEYWTTSSEEELEYSFTNGGEGPELRTDVWNCLADYLGTGQIWRGNDNLSTNISIASLEQVLNQNRNIVYVAGDIRRTVDWRYTSMLYGLYLYVQDKGYSLDKKISGTYTVDVAGGGFTFEDYKAEIDAGRPVVISILGHSMVGYGYNAGTREIIFDDCYESDKRMVWDGTYLYADMYLPLQSITVIGLMAETNLDLALVPVSGASSAVLLSTSKNALETEHYCFLESPLYVSFAVSNLGETASGAFAVSIYVDGELANKLSPFDLKGGAASEQKNIQLPELGLGLHSVRIEVDEDNNVSESSGANNSGEQKLMVLKKGTNIVTGYKQVYSGTVSKDDYVSSGWQMHVHDGGTAEGTIVQGKVTGVSYESVSYLPGLVAVSQGALIRDADVYEYGQIQVSGAAENIRVFNEGAVVLSAGATLSGVSVGAGGQVSLESGCVLTGPVQVEKNAFLSLADGVVLNFDLTRTNASADALVNDLSLIYGTPVCTVTVSGTEEEGIYRLAEGAAQFNGTISVVNTAGDALGSLAVNDALKIGEADYILNLSDSVLSLAVVYPVPDLTPQNLVGTADRVSWETTGAKQYIVEYSTDGFEHAVSIVTGGNAVDMPDLPAGTYRWRVRADDEGSDWAVGEALASETGSAAPKVVRSNADGSADVFFAQAAGTWESGYVAQHVGSVNDWTGTNEYAAVLGKNKLADIFEGSADANILLLTDDPNGDGLFVDDIYSDSPDELGLSQSRIARLDEIRAGAGDDVVDMTSQRFEYLGDGLTIRGGDGDDVIWANKGGNMLFGDAGNDRIVGASGSDMIAGGIGNDRMHGGGGDDVFAFCGNWGEDEVKQLESGSVTLWFASGSETNWDAETLTYTDGGNSVTVSGIAADQVTLKFGDDGSERFAALTGTGAFLDVSSERIFEEPGKGILASL